jgi:hypothetical protein
MEPRAPLPPSAAAPPPLARPAGAPLATPFPAIVAFSEELSPLQQVAAAIGEQAGMIFTPAQDRFVDQLVANSAEVALIDATIAPNALTSFLGGLHHQFPQLRIVLLGAAQLQEALRGQIADGTVFGFAQQPVSAERLKLLLLAALRAAPPEASPAMRGAAAGPADAAGGTDVAATAGAAHWAGAATLPGAAGPGATATMIPASVRPRWLWPLLLCLTTLAAMIVGWYASSFASQRHLLP